MEDLERRALGQGEDFYDTAINLGVAMAAVVGGYNLAGAMLDHSQLSEGAQYGITTGILAASGIIGYKIRSGIKKVAGLLDSGKKKVRRDFARAKTLAAISKDQEFQERQGIHKGDSGPIRNALKYAISVPAGGALGYFPGAAGIIPLCVYFGDKYKWDENAQLSSGPWAGAVIGAWAFGEMAHKKEYRRMVTTGAALAGIAAGHFLGGRAMGLNAFHSPEELWGGLFVDAVCGAAAGAIGYGAYKFIDTCNKIGKDDGVESIEDTK